MTALEWRHESPNVVVCYRAGVPRRLEPYCIRELDRATWVAVRGVTRLAVGSLGVAKRAIERDVEVSDGRGAPGAAEGLLRLAGSTG